MSAEREKLLQDLEQTLHEMNTGQRQAYPGQPLLPTAYRGSADFIPVMRAWTVLHNGKLVAGFQRRTAAQRWCAWVATERGISIDEMLIQPVVLMDERRIGPLFDDAAAPLQPSRDGGLS